MIIFSKGFPLVLLQLTLYSIILFMHLHVFIHVMPELSFMSSLPQWYDLFSILQEFKSFAYLRNGQ